MQVEHRMLILNSILVRLCLQTMTPVQVIQAQVIRAQALQVQAIQVQATQVQATQVQATQVQATQVRETQVTPQAPKKDRLNLQKLLVKPRLMAMSLLSHRALMIGVALPIWILGSIHLYFLAVVQ